MGTNSIALHIFNDPSEAPNYNTDGKGTLSANLDAAIIVKNGTESGSATVDLQFTDKNGQRYVAMITANLLRMVLAATDRGEQ